MSYLREEQYYIDLYDRGTVEQCRRLENKGGKPTNIPDDLKDMSEKVIQPWFELVGELASHFAAAEQYNKKADAIDGWMTRDRQRDELLENFQPKTNLRCTRCAGSMHLIHKDLRLGFNEPDQVMTMFECNLCQKRRLFRGDREWVPEPDYCEKCHAVVSRTSDHMDKKSVVTYACPRCGHSWQDVWESEPPKEEVLDPDYEADRQRFCYSEKVQSYAKSYQRAQYMPDFLKEVKEKEANKELYDELEKIKKLNIADVETLLIPSLEKVGFKNLSFSAPEIDRAVIVNFSVQDAYAKRTNLASCSDFKKALKAHLADTNWRLMSDGPYYRLGFLTGRLKGHTLDEDLKKLAEANLKKAKKK